MNVLHIVTNEDAPFFKQQIGHLERKGVNCTVVTVPGKPTTRSITDYIRTSLPIWKNSLKDYDLVHANYGLTAPIALSQPTRPIILSLWGSDLLGKYGTVSKKCSKRFDAVTVRSEEMKKELDCPSYILPSGVDLETFHPIDKEVAREQVGWKKGVKHALFPYDIYRKRKNFPLAKGVIDNVNSSQKFGEMIILHTLGDVSHSDMKLYYNASDLVLLTSKYEGSPNTVKEAMACNTPVVTTPVGDVSKRLKGVFESNVCHSEEEFTESIIDLLANQEGNSNGREQVRDVSWDNISDELIDIYEHAIRARSN